MEIDHGGFELSMAHVSLDDPQVDSGFQKMGSVGVSQGMDGDGLFVDSSSGLGPAEGPLDTTFGHGRGSGVCSVTASAKSREEEAGVTVGGPIASEQLEGGKGERDVAILGALPPGGHGSSCGWNRYRRLRGGDLHGVSSRRNRRWRDRRNSGRF